MEDVARFAKALYADRWTTYEIAAAFGVDQATVRRWLDQAQVPRRRTGPRGRVDVADDDVRSAVEDDQLSYTDAARDLGMSKTGVQYRYWRLTGRARTR